MDSNPTIVYMVRHGDSPKEGEVERLRGLSAQGQEDARRVTDRLRGEGIDRIYSSPYRRAVLTVAGLAEETGIEIEQAEDLRELEWSSSNYRMPDKELYPLLNKMFADPDYALPGGESKRDCQTRAIAVLMKILNRHQGERVAIGTHAMVMTLMLEHFSAEYGLDFLMQTTKPDIYRMEFSDLCLSNGTRLSYT